MSERLVAALDGQYKIIREAGAGGMATVYLAEDLKHDRNVALKVLRPELAATLGPARFFREIQVAARLQHPHILPLHDSGEAGGFLYYVMPFVDGESLRERLARVGELPIHDAVKILMEVVDALAYAHGQGVVHRDIKPDNVMLSGRHALVTDFGVAKAVSEATGKNQLTTAGVALGTPSYMAPEQAAADPLLDHRVDIYAVGAMGYELLTGRPPFIGMTPQQVLAAHVTQAPDPVSRYRAAVTPQLEAVIMRCLAKRAADRWQTAEELLQNLEPLATPSGGMTPTNTRPISAIAPPRLQWARSPRVVIPALLAGATLGAWYVAQRPAPLPVLGRSEQFTSDPGLEIQPAISPDGRMVAFSAGTNARMRIYLRPVVGGRTLTLTDDTAAVETQARWSPDGSSLLFLTRGGVSTAPALGGIRTSVVAFAAPFFVRSAAWSPDGRSIAFARADSVFVQAVAGGAPHPIGVVEDVHSCTWSPMGRWIACVSMNAESILLGATFGNLAPSRIVLVPVDGGEVIDVLGPTAVNQSPVWAADGRRLFFISNRDGPRDIYAQSLSASGQPRGEPLRMTTGLGALSISISANGDALAYSVYAARANVWALPIPTGAATTAVAATPMTTGNQVIESMHISADGRWLLYDSDLHGNADVYRIPVAGGAFEALTSDPADEFAPDLSPDGRSVVYHTWRTGTRDIEVRPLDGGPVEHVTESPAQESYPLWSPDGMRLVFYDQGGEGALLTSRRGADGHWASPVRITAPAASPVWSPDGASILYLGADFRSQREAVMIVPAEGGVPRRLYVPNPTSPPVNRLNWSRDGRTVYFKSHDQHGLTSFWSVPVEGGTPRLLVRFTEPERQSARPDFSVDDRRFYFTIEDRQSDIFVATLSHD